MTRSEERAAALRETGARAVVLDVFDQEGVRAAIAEARPEVLVHQLTALPERIDPRDRSVYDATNRLRREGTRVLLASARAAGARRVVAQSIAFAYEPQGDMITVENAPLMRDAPGPFGDGVRAVRDLEAQVLEAQGLEGLVLRYGFFYGPGTFYARDGSMAADVRRRRMPIVGSGAGMFSHVHVEDAADATLVAVERGAAGVYNIVDDEPAPLREWVPVYADAIGAKPPWRLPAWLARLVAGKAATVMAMQLRGASNEKAKRELGWTPAHASWRRGFRDSLA